MRRRYLIIAMDMADSAAGMVFKRLLRGMTAFSECDVICPEVDETMGNWVRLLRCGKYRRLPYRVERWLYRRFGYNVTDFLWAMRTYVNVRGGVMGNGYDGILSFVYSGDFSPLILGRKLKEEMDLPWAVYSVDAIPAPVAWSNSTVFRKRVLNYLEGYMECADALFSANPVMLRYEREAFLGFKGYGGVVLTPYEGDAVENVSGGVSDYVTFLYAGYVYGPRRITELLRGFELLLEAMPNVKLVFVGHNNISQFRGVERLVDSGAVERHAFTRNVEEFYRRADVLIDLNADVENDVYLSSKVCNYLSYKKPILAISQEGSPVRLMMSGISTIVHCHHDAEEICCSMRRTISMIGGSFEDREVLKNQFRTDVVAYNFCSDLEKIFSNRLS